jgi:Na+-transporting NADH:ubiquinone oxidoreductase subunit F
MTYIHAIAVLCSLGGVLTVGLLAAERWLARYGPCRIVVNGGERDVTVEGGDTLLAALYDQEVFIPSACGGKGTCGFCKVRVLDGGGPVLATERPYLTQAEIRKGTRLACQVKVRNDLRIHIREDYLHVQQFTGRVAEARMLTHDTRQLVIDLVEPGRIDFRAGQYVQVCAPGPDGPAWRAYSISSPPQRTDRIELLVRLVPGGVGSTYLHSVQPGEQIVFTGPYGEFELADDQGVEVVCVGGGCGMAPMRAIVHDVLRRWPGRPVRLFFGCRTREDVLYHEEFARLAADHPSLEIHYALSDEPDKVGWDGERGFIHESVDAHLDPGGRRQAFLCGPEAMIEATTTVLHAKGLPKHKVFYDAF